MVGNKGSSGLDRMKVKELQGYRSTHQRKLGRDILGGNYVPKAIRGEKITKRNF